MGCCAERDICLGNSDAKETISNTSECAQSEGVVEHPQNEDYRPLLGEEVIVLTPDGPVAEPQGTHSAPPPAEVRVKYTKKPKSFDTEVLILKDREAYAMTLIEKAENWEPWFEGEHMVVKFMPGTKFSKATPAVHLYLDFEIDVDFSLVMSVLEDVPMRSQWDKAVAAIEITPIEATAYETCYTKFNLFLVERNFVERRHRQIMEKELRISFVSVRDERYPVGATTGETFLGLYRIFKTEKGSTAILLLNQSDYRLDGITKNLYDNGRGATSKKWLENFKERVKEATSSSK